MSQGVAQDLDAARQLYAQAPAAGHTEAAAPLQDIEAELAKA